MEVTNEVFAFWFSPLCLVFEIRYVFYSYSTSRWRLATFQIVIEILKWLVATTLDRVALDSSSVNLNDSPSYGRD